MTVLRGELHRIEVDLAVGDLDIWDWWMGGFARFLVWCGVWSLNLIPVPNEGIR